MILAQGLSKSFSSGRGRRRTTVRAVADVAFAARDGAITALLGPNGAGKTTTLRMISTLVAPDSGHASVDGADCAREPLAVRSRLGALSDARGLYTRLTARENIAYFGRLRGMEEAAVGAAIERLSGQIGLGPLLDRRTDGFSQGERMKVALARALLHDPPNLVLDEPTNGLDIMATRSLRELLRGLREAGKCIVLSSHVMQEVAMLCDEIVIVAHGRTVAHGTLEALCEQAGVGDLEEAFVRLAFAEELEGGTA